MYNFSGIDEFLDSWKKTSLYKTDFTIVQSELEKSGRICSDEKTLSGPILAKGDENFYLTLEAGIVNLIRTLIDDYGLITIGSCEGHDHLSNQFNISKRFAKILWRNREEYKLYYPFFKGIADTVNISHKNIKIAFFDFEDEFPDQKMYHLCFIVFVPFQNNSEIYFTEINEIYTQFTQALILKKNEISVPPDYQNM